MKTKEEFKGRFNQFRTLFLRSNGPFYIPGGRDKYLVTDVDPKLGVTIKQGESYQKHKIDQLESLFTDGFFIGPKNGKKNDRLERTGHIGMKNSIVDFLENL